MSTQTLIKLVAVLTIGILWTVPGSADTLADMEEVHGGPLPEAWQYDEWPEDSEVRRGFHFVKTDYDMLDGYSISKDNTTVQAWWDVESQSCMARVERVVVLARADSTVTITIGVFPSNKFWKMYFASRHLGRTLQILYRRGNDYGVDIGDLVLLNAPLSDEDAEGWDGQTATSLKFMVANLMIDLSAQADDVEVSMPGLAALMVEKIADQENERNSQGLPLAPTATLTCAEEVVEFTSPEQDTINLGVELEVSDVQGEEHRSSFLMTKLTDVDLPPTLWLPTIDPEDATVYGRRILADEMFDSIENPAHLPIFQGNADVAKLAGFVVWGDNLVPVVATDTFTVETAID